MDPAIDHTVNEANVRTEDSAYGAIVTGAIALVFLAFVVHAATLPTQDAAAPPPPSGATATKAAH
ncbi:hypothetical protein FNL55_01545 [Tardiphaga sp. vice352]|uniref:hypothetical protein n=1 Tax=unclassified Tardiphaga TaxID=2631404 RepID=UPI0011635F17|nr:MULTISPECIES: hypothetical protein [unclassified Tardiphaga]QDM14779.1 hypothetical protein FNL53_01550 [Tardiphaga sp. vice278]QDM24961.1 hypothetical protein FNL56_01460 [Tardiphaga sp. vice304]QDM30169.1 hypothetical protein FNL55_01545 [Tardiphaga sp. vice352]